MPELTPIPPADLSTREHRIERRLAARGEAELFTALLQLRGQRLDAKRTLDRLFAVGGEGALFTVANEDRPEDPLVGKIPMVPWHKPIQLTSAALRERRAIIRGEAEILKDAGCPFFPRFRGLLHFENPLLEVARGGEFQTPEPCLLMERLGGFDLDLWLCRVHRGGYLTKAVLRPVLDRIVLSVVRGLTDLEERGFLYADLRPGNFRVLGRPQRLARLLDAGSCVREGNGTDRFPHVPSYLPPQVYRAEERGEAIEPTRAVMASMAGRTLYEVATGQAPRAASYVDMMRLVRSPVSPPVAEEIAALANENYRSCGEALEALMKRANRAKRR